MLRQPLKFNCVESKITESHFRWCWWVCSVAVQSESGTRISCVFRVFQFFFLPTFNCDFPYFIVSGRTWTIHFGIDQRLREAIYHSTKRLTGRLDGNDNSSGGPLTAMTFISVMCVPIFWSSCYNIIRLSLTLSWQCTARPDTTLGHLSSSSRMHRIQNGPLDARRNGNKPKSFFYRNFVPLGFFFLLDVIGDEMNGVSL